MKASRYFLFFFLGWAASSNASSRETPPGIFSNPNDACHQLSSIGLDTRKDWRMVDYGGGDISYQCVSNYKDLSNWVDTPVSNASYYVTSRSQDKLEKMWVSINVNDPYVEGIDYLVKAASIMLQNISHINDKQSILDRINTKQPFAIEGKNYQIIFEAEQTAIISYKFKIINKN